jgi:hypothetical protein
MSELIGTTHAERMSEQTVHVSLAIMAELRDALLAAHRAAKHKQLFWLCRTQAIACDLLADWERRGSCALADKLVEELEATP